MTGGTNDAVTQNQSACKPKFSLQWFHTKSLLTHSVNLCTIKMLTLSQWKQMQTFLPPVKDPHNSFTNWLNIKSYYNWTISLLSQRMKEVEIQGLLWWDLMQQIQSIRWSIGLVAKYVLLLLDKGKVQSKPLWLETLDSGWRELPN